MSDFLVRVGNNLLALSIIISFAFLIYTKLKNQSMKETLDDINNLLDFGGEEE